MQDPGHPHQKRCSSRAPHCFDMSGIEPDARSQMPSHANGGTSSAPPRKPLKEEHYYGRSCSPQFYCSLLLLNATDKPPTTPPLPATSSANASHAGQTGTRPPYGTQCTCVPNKITREDKPLRRPDMRT